MAFFHTHPLMTTAVFAKMFPLPFHSKLIDWLEQCPQKIATIPQWLGMLNNLQNIRKEELELSGLYDFLTSMTIHTNELGLRTENKIRKSELIKIARAELSKCEVIIQSHWKQSFHPSINVKTQPEKRPLRIENKAKRFVEKAQSCYQHPSLGFWIIRTGYEDLATIAPNWIVLDQRGKMLQSHHKHQGWFPTAVEAFDEMHRVIRMRFAEFGTDRPSTVFDQYAFLGGNNYQEWFVCLPNWPNSYKDDHFDLEQLLIHIRTTERLDQDGNPLLMVEELQSPWLADIRKFDEMLKEGEIDEDDERLVPAAPFEHEWHELAIKALIWLAIKQGYQRIGFTSGKQQCDRWGHLDGLMNLYDIDVPKTLKRIASRFECELSWSTIVTRKPDGSVRLDRKTGWIVRDKNNKPITPPLLNKDVALHFLGERSSLVKEPVRVLQVSQKLKEALLKNEVPLFGW